MNIRFSGSTSLQMIEATEGLVFAWKSMPMSNLSPSPSRSVCRRRTAALIRALPSIHS
jgi:hypothetical protein